MRVLIYGAGVIGQIYGGRLAQAGHEVTLLARPQTAALLTAHGITLERGGEASSAQPHVTTKVPAGAAFDIALVTVRRDQLAEILPAIAELTTGRIALMLNQCVDLELVRERVGSERTVFTFPGVGGQRTKDGAIAYLEISQQKTTIERRHGIEAPVVDLLRSAGFALDMQTDMAAWLKTHAVFITAVGAAILEAGGDSERLAADRARVAAMVAAVGEGFRTLERQNIGITPTPLRLIFTVVPRFLAVSYWQRQLRGPLGTLAIAPHVRATRETEFPVMCADVRRLVAGHGSTPQLDRLLEVASATYRPPPRRSA
jgi:2-dehydropantoate 2-reductase